jgi:hypothetical protein
MKALRVKSSLDTIRKNGVNCRTKHIEGRIRNEIEEQFGPIKIPEKQYRKIMRQDAIHKKKIRKMQKSLMKAFQQREAALLIQKLRNESSKVTYSGRNEVKSRKKEADAGADREEEGVFNEICIEY